MNIHYFQTVLLSFYCILISIIVLSNCSFDERIHIEKDKIHIKYEHQLKDGTSDFQQIFDISKFMITNPKNCSTDNKNMFCLQWENYAQFKITKFDGKCEDYAIESKYTTLTITFNIHKIHLYGGQGTEKQIWPIEYNNFTMEPYITIKHGKTSVIEPYWLTSSGFYLHIEEEVPLFITLNNTENIFRITAKRDNPYIRLGDTVLKYKVCKFDNMRLAHEHAAANVLGKPTKIPDTRMVELPIWTTWAKYKTNISQNIVLEFAKSIVHYGFPNSQLEIDDKWETCYGSLEVDKRTFPDMKNLVKQLKDLGYRVTLWVHPFINIDCEPYFSVAKNLNYLVKRFSSNTVETKWWNGNGGHIDFTNPDAANWFKARLIKLREEYSINSFKFDAGECGLNPQLPFFYEMQNDYPETNLKAYIKTASYFGNMTEFRSARDTQKYPVFTRMMDLETRWKGAHSLSTMIPVLLHMNIIGYPFVLPDIIGGNGYNGYILSEELFIRWLQLSTFMPAIQFSYPPWDFGENVTKIAKKFVDLHKKYAKNIIQAMNRTTVSGSPVNPPIWWIDPTNPVAQIIDTEFLLGEDILVAPVINKGANSRDIYLPKGIWKDEVKGDIIKGPKWLINYQANLEVLPYFSKISNSAESMLPKLILIFFLIIIIFI